MSSCDVDFELDECRPIGARLRDRWARASDCDTIPKSERKRALVEFNDIIEQDIITPLRYAYDRGLKCQILIDRPLEGETTIIAGAFHNVSAHGDLTVTGIELSAEPNTEEEVITMSIADLVGVQLIKS